MDTVSAQMNVLEDKSEAELRAILTGWEKPLPKEEEPDDTKHALLVAIRQELEQNKNAKFPQSIYKPNVTGGEEEEEGIVDKAKDGIVNIGNKIKSAFGMGENENKNKNAKEIGKKTGNGEAIDASKEEAKPSAGEDVPSAPPVPVNQ